MQQCQTTVPSLWLPFSGSFLKNCSLFFPHWLLIICPPFSPFTILMLFLAFQILTSSMRRPICSGSFCLKLKFFCLLLCYPNTFSFFFFQYLPLIMSFHQGQTLRSEVINTSQLEHVHPFRLRTPVPEMPKIWGALARKIGKLSLKSVANNWGSHTLSPWHPQDSAIAWHHSTFHCGEGERIFFCVESSSWSYFSPFFLPDISHRTAGV